MDNGNQLKVRLVVAGIAGLIITALSLSMVPAASSDIGFPQWLTQRTLKDLDVAVRAYRNKHHSLPRALANVRTLPDKSGYFQDDGIALDGWGNPWIYSVQGASYLILSYGADGKPGGVWLDCDLSNANPDPPQAKPTYLQLLLNPLARGIVWASIFSGVITFVLTLTTVKLPEATAHGWIALSIQLIVILTIAGCVAMFLIMLHTLSGH